MSLSLCKVVYRTPVCRGSQRFPSSLFARQLRRTTKVFVRKNIGHEWKITDSQAAVLKSTPWT